MKRTAIVVVFLSALVVSVLVVARPGAPGETGQAQGPLIVGFDMDPTGNSCPYDGTNCTLGSIDQCVEVPSGGGVVEFDVFLEDLPIGEDILGWWADIDGWPGLFTGQSCLNGTISLTAQPGSQSLCGCYCGDPLYMGPDDTPPHGVCSCDYVAAEPNPPYTHGTLGRYTLDTSGVADGFYGMTLDSLLVGNNGGNDLCVVWGCQIWDVDFVPTHGVLAVGLPCPGDGDGDGALDPFDNCPDEPNADQTDTDSDGMGDACDACPNDPENDADSDGVCGGVDNCPDDPNADQTDTDSDGIGDPCDNCPDHSNAEQTDTDSDGIGDPCDNCPDDPNNDVDSDGICGDVDNCPDDANAEQTDTDSDGMGDACDACPNDSDNDVDSDGVCGDVDNCPDDANAEQTDTDSDGIGDACDNCPDDANAEQTDTDSDGIGDACDNCPDDANAEQTDTDSDGIGDACDNCPDEANAAQTDTDSDGIGDACDACPNDPEDDADSDGLCGDVDNCPDDPNAEQTDADSDGIGDPCDNCPDDANASQADTDSDGLGDRCDNCPEDQNPGQIDGDGDGWGDACDNCPATATLWYVPAGDDDCDGFSTAGEEHMGTDPLDACPDSVDDDAWPVDLNAGAGCGVGHDGNINILDVLCYKGKLTPNPYDARYDLSQDPPAGVNILDLLRYHWYIYLSCTNP